MIEKIRPPTGYDSPGGGGHGITWKGIKKCTRNNAQYYINDRKDQITYMLC